MPLRLPTATVHARACPKSHPPVARPRWPAGLVARRIDGRQRLEPLADLAHRRQRHVACEVPLEHKRIAHQTAQNTAGDFMKITTALRVAEGLRNVWLSRGE